MGERGGAVHAEGSHPVGPAWARPVGPIAPKVVQVQRQEQLLAAGRQLGGQLRQHAGQSGRLPPHDGASGRDQSHQDLESLSD